MIAVELSFMSTDERMAARPAHRKNLERWHREGTLLAAGPWSDDSGALLIFRADESEVEKLMTGDSYFATRGVTVTSIREWSPVVSPT
ncbi:MAG: YciI family protein [Acidimicrobiales bacterium]